MFKPTKPLVALAAAALLAACGGGDDLDSARGAADGTAQAAASAMRAQSAAQGGRMRALAVGPLDAAEQLLNYAEISPFRDYFPGPQTTQSLEVFRYRYYPTKDIYLGVVVIDNPTYRYNGVYVMGGEFGNAPAYVGQVSDFIAPVDAGPTGFNNDCWDLEQADTRGTRSAVTYEYSGAISGTQTVDSQVGNLVAFDGLPGLRETITRTTGTSTSAAGTVEVNLTLRNYARRTGDAELTHYGSLSTADSVVGGIDVSHTTRIVWSPPWVDRRYALAVGQSLTTTQRGTLTATVSMPNLPDQSTTSSTAPSTTTRYLGRESVTVPAGTYNACKFESISSGAPNELSTSWIIVARGIPVQTVVSNSAGVVTQTIKATSVKYNGEAI